VLSAICETPAMFIKSVGRLPATVMRTVDPWLLLGAHWTGSGLSGRHLASESRHSHINATSVCRSGGCRAELSAGGMVGFSSEI
jgi:hypothetical protein